MSKKLKRVRWLVFALSFLILFYFAFLQYNSLIQIDFPSADLGFENLDREDLIIDHSTQSKVIASAAFIDLGLVEIHAFNDSGCSSFQSLSFDQTSILRC